MRERPIIFSGEMVRAILDGRKTQTRRVVKPQASLDGFSPKFIAQARVVPGGLVHEANGGRTGIPLPCPYGVPGDRLWVREAWRVLATGVEVPPVPALTGAEIGYRAGGAEWLECPLAEIGYRAGGAEWLECPLAFYEREDEREDAAAHCWRPSIHMPRWASRITLEITEVRVERLQEISADDAEAEGLARVGFSRLLKVPLFAVSPEADPKRHYSSEGTTFDCARAAYRDLWDVTHAPRHIRRRARAGKPTDRYESRHPARTEPSPFGWDANPWVWVLTFRRVEVAHA